MNFFISIVVWIIVFITTIIIAKKRSWDSGYISLAGITGTTTAILSKVIIELLAK